MVPDLTVYTTPNVQDCLIDISDTAYLLGWYPKHGKSDMTAIKGTCCKNGMALQSWRQVSASHLLEEETGNIQDLTVNDANPSTKNDSVDETQANSYNHGNTKIANAIAAIPQHGNINTARESLFGSTNEQWGSFMLDVDQSLYMPSIPEPLVDTSRRDINAFDKWHWLSKDDKYSLPAVQNLRMEEILV